MKSVVKSANTVRVGTSPIAQAKRRFNTIKSDSATDLDGHPKHKRVKNAIQIERPHSKAGGSKTGHEKDANNYKVTNFSSGMSSGKSLARKKSGLDDKMFRSREAILRMIEDTPLPTAALEEKEYLAEYLHLFKTLQVMVRLGEDKYIDGNQSSRDVYALMTMYSQLREVINDIRSVTDMSHHANTLVQTVLQPAIVTLAQSLITMFYHIRVLIREVSKDEHTMYAIERIDEMTRDAGLLLQDRYEDMSRRVQDYLVRE